MERQCINRDKVIITLTSRAFLSPHPTAKLFFNLIFFFDFYRSFMTTTNYISVILGYHPPDSVSRRFQLREKENNHYTVLNTEKSFPLNRQEFLSKIPRQKYLVETIGNHLASNMFICPVNYCRVNFFKKSIQLDSPQLHIQAL